MYRHTPPISLIDLWCWVAGKSILAPDRTRPTAAGWCAAPRHLSPWVEAPTVPSRARVSLSPRRGSQNFQSQSRVRPSRLRPERPTTTCPSVQRSATQKTKQLFCLPCSRRHTSVFAHPIHRQWQLAFKGYDKYHFASPPHMSGVCVWIARTLRFRPAGEHMQAGPAGIHKYASTAGA